MNWRRLTCVAAVAALGCGDSELDTETHTAEQVIEAPAMEPAPMQRTLSSKIAPEERLHYLTLSPHDFGAELEIGHRVDLYGRFPIAAKPELPTAVKTPETREEREVVKKREAMQTSNKEVRTVVMLVLQNVMVLDLEVTPDGSRVGLVLTPDEVQTLLLAEERGHVHALLRHPSDAGLHTITKATLREVLEDLEVLQEKRQLRERVARKTQNRPGPNLRALTVDERGISLHHRLPLGSLVAGDRVDLHGLFRASPVLPVAMTLLQNVHVLKVVKDRAVLAVSQDEINLLLAALSNGEISFSLRNREDVEVSTITKKTLREVLEDLEVIQEKRQIRVRKRPSKRKKMAHGIEIIRGDSGGGYVRPAAVAAPPTSPAGFTDHGTNPFTDPTEDRFSTFGIDVDTASYTIGRRMIKQGQRPAAASVRVEEWLNYFTYDYPKPDGGAFAVSLEAAPSPFQANGAYKLVRVGVQGKTLTEAERKPVHLTFLVDTSGSMRSKYKLGLVKDSLRHLAVNLRPTDTVAIATYAGSTEVLLRPTHARNTTAIIAAIDSLSSGGGTAMNDGMKLAYELAAENLQHGHENRVIVLSDGDANIGGANYQTMLNSISKQVKKGITMSTIGFGMGSYKDSTMEQLANRGNGNYFYIDNFSEAQKVFSDQLDGTLQTIAKDVKIQVEFNPTAVKRYRLIGYENRDIADKDFRNDKVDAGEIGAGHTVTALYEVELADTLPETIATVRVRYKQPHGSDSAREAALELPASAVVERLSDASDSLRFAAAVAATAEIARKSPYAAALNYDWVLEVARGAQGTYGDRAEFIELVKSLQRL